jgi:hypothetical protein
MEDSSFRLTSENDWESETEEGNSENGHLIEKVPQNIHRPIQNRFHWSVWIVTAVNVAVFAGTLILAARWNDITRCKEFTDADAIRRTQSYCESIVQNPVIHT